PWHQGCRSATPGREGKDMHFAETDFSGEGQGLLELLISFSGDGDMANCIRPVSIVSVSPDGLLGKLAR
ncbi:MAG: hypothetical protein M1319_00850, partial [Chloroflexi bacterium]|nr:hypothetical protein [Chloroflexota bacterium]